MNGSVILGREGPKANNTSHSPLDGWLVPADYKKDGIRYTKDFRGNGRSGHNRHTVLLIQDTKRS